MNGTQKQINWATDIKARRIADLEKLEELPIPPNHPAARALVTVREQYESTDANNAGWWIAVDQTVLKTEQLANEIVKGKEIRWPVDTNQGWE